MPGRRLPAAISRKRQKRLKTGLRSQVVKLSPLYKHIPNHSQDFQSTPSALQVKKTEREEEKTLRTTTERRRVLPAQSPLLPVDWGVKCQSEVSMLALSGSLSLSLSEEEEWDRFMGPAVSDYTTPPASASIHVSQTKRFYSMAPLQQPAT